MKKGLKKAGIITLAGLIAASPVTVFGAQTKAEVAAETQMAEEDLDFEFSPEQEAIWDKIDAVYDKLNKLNEENSSLWVKLYGDVTERFDKDFDEKEYIKESKILSDEEKDLLISHIETEEALYAEISDYWTEYFRLEDPDYESTDDATWNKIRALTDRSYSVRFAHPDLWDKIELAIFEVENRTEDFDYADFISNMETLSKEDKELALKDLNVRNIFDTIIDDMILSLD